MSRYLHIVLLSTVLGLATTAWADLGTTPETAEKIARHRLDEMKTTLPKEGASTEYYDSTGNRAENATGANAAYTLKFNVTDLNNEPTKTVREVEMLVEWKPDPQVNQVQKLRLKTYLAPSNTDK